MNTVELKIHKEENEFWLKLLVDSKRVLSEEALVFEELIKSLTGTGKFLIFTCTCGIADCAGWDKISVKHDKSTVKWNFEYGEITHRYEFDKSYYKGEIERISWELRNQKIELSPKYLIYPE